LESEKPRHMIRASGRVSQKAELWHMKTQYLLGSYTTTSAIPKRRIFYCRSLLLNIYVRLHLGIVGINHGGIEGCSKIEFLHDASGSYVESTSG
jgi:hypothetical protein